MQDDAEREERDRQRAALLAYLDGKIARWWMPDDVLVVEAIPLGATGKIDKKLLRRQFADYRLPK